MCMENEFEALEADLNKIQVTLNTTAASDKILETKQKIHGIKKRVQAICNTVPYTRLPPLKISQIVSYDVLCINGILFGSSISYTLYPHTIMTGTTLYLKNTEKLN